MQCTSVNQPFDRGGEAKLRGDSLITKVLRESPRLLASSVVVVVVHPHQDSGLECTRQDTECTLQGVLAR